MYRLSSTILRMNILRNENRRIGIQILSWLLAMMIIGTILINIGAPVPVPNYAIPRLGILILGMSLVIILNIKYFVPYILLKRPTYQYVISIFVFLILMVFLFGIFESHFLPQHTFSGEFRPSEFEGKSKERKFFSKFFPFGLAILISTIGETLHFANLRNSEAIQLKSEKLETEMKFLKSQVNPHFLFNALNNVYTLAIIKADETPDVILRLSDMLRYMLYDCKDDVVPLQKELDYIKNYIALYQLKEDKPFNVEIDMEKVNGNVMIPPMVFIPFIENSFKHSKIEDFNQSWIKMSLTTNGTLNFNIKNSIPQAEFTKDKIGGIGLENVKRRLELLYPNQHELEILNDGEVFDVKLVVDLK